jgi:uncharacterized repeat protein (TIGR01451 family)
MKYLYLICLCLPLHVVAQGWQRYYEGDRLFSLQVRPDGSLVAAGSRSDGGNPSNIYLLQTDAYGQLLWEQAYGVAGETESAAVLLPGATGTWQIVGNNANGQILHLTTSNNGQILQPLTNITNGTLYHAALRPDGNTTMACGTQTPSVGSNVTRAWTSALNTAGQVIWSRTDSIGISAVANAVLPLGNGATLVAGTYNRSAQNPNYDFFLLKTGENGGLMANYTYETPENERVSGIYPMNNGTYQMVGAAYNTDNPTYLEEDIWLTRLDTSGNILWNKHIPLLGFQVPHATAILPDGRMAIAGETRATVNGSRDAFVALADNDGNLLWYKTYGGVKGDIFWDIAAMPDGGFALAGQSASFGDGTLHAWLLRTDQFGEVWQNTVSGTVAHDAVQNCQLDTSEMPLENWLVTAAGTQGKWYTTTDAAGNYHFSLDTGTWYISVLPFATAWLPCLDSVPVVFSGMNDSLELDFLVQANYACPVMEVDIATPFLRRCFENTYTVRYFNYGTITANNAQIRVLPDQYLTPTGSNWPYTTSGDTLVFAVGDVPIQQGGSLQFTALLDCDSTVLGQMHCITAHITPDSLCSAIDPGWDGANLDVNGYCAGDSVVLILTNTGTGGMNEPLEYVITEDQIIFKMQPIQLAAGESVTVVVYPNGATVTLTVPQTPGHPSSSQPMLVIEGCGGLGVGFAFQFPTNDGDLSTDIDCRPNIGSFDPNDKTGLPLGVDTDRHFIAAGTAIEYLIRFQNTGTDTAFRVEIRDTLAPGLDISTLEQGAGSHPYHLERLGMGVLRFVFDGIVLPDSLSNVNASQGFVKYRIKTHKNLANGVEIRNRAAIYFDFNLPVITASTLHTIGEPILQLWTNTDAPYAQEQASIQAVPNPFQSSTRLTWPKGTAGNYQLRFVNALGTTVFQTETQDNTYLFDRQYFKGQALWVQIEQNGQRVAVGHIISLAH